MTVIHLDKNNFEAEVLKNKGIVLVDFYAQWCGPCKMTGPIIEQLAEEINNVKFAEIDIDMEEKLAQKYMVRAVPCIIIFKDGKEVNRIIGYQNKEYFYKNLSR